MKKLFIALGVLVGLLLLAIIVIPLVVDVDKYRPQIVQAANEHVNGKVELGKLSLSLWGQVRVQVAGLSVTDASGNKVLGVEDAYFHLPFSSLLTGSPSLTFKMEKPTVNVIKDKNGKLNVMSLAKPSAASAAQPGAEQPKTAPAAGGATSLPSIATRARLGVELRDAEIVYQDFSKGAANAIETKVTDFNIVFRDISLSRETEMEIWADLNTTIGKTLHVQGPFKITGRGKPQVSGGKFEQIQVDVKANFDDLDITSGEIFHKSKGMAANADLSVTASETAAKLDRLDVKFFNAEVKTAGTVSNLAAQNGQPADPSVNLTVVSNDISLKSWEQLVPMLKQYELAGTMKLDAAASGPSSKLGYRAKFTVAGLTAKAPNLKAQPRFDALISVVTDQVDNLTFTMKAPGNDLRISGKVIGFVKPKADFSVTSSGMDLDQLIDFPKAPAAAEAKAAPADAQTADAAKAKPVDMDAMLDPMRENKALAEMACAIDVNMKSIKAKGAVISDIVGRLTFKDLTAAIEKFSLRAFSGTMKASMATQLKPKAPTYQFSMNVDSLDLGQAVASQMAMFKDTIVGKASFSMNGNGASFNPEPAKVNLKAKGSMKVVNATFASVDVGKMVGEALNGSIDKIGDKVPPLKGKKLPTLPSGASQYESISGNFTINDGRFSAPDFYAKAMPNKGIDIKGATEVGLKDQSLKTSWEIIDTYNLTKAKDLSINQAGIEIPHVLAEGDGPVRFPVSAGCTIKAPCYSYTQVAEALGKVALGNAGKAVAGKAKAEVRKKAESLIQQHAPPALQDQLKKLGGGLFN
jgi:hypothetical protein